VPSVYHDILPEVLAKPTSGRVIRFKKLDIVKLLSMVSAQKDKQS
jgi:hypothetical protein